MNEDLKKLLNDFKRISRKKWIKCDTESFGGVGSTFERLLNKDADSLYFPDYYGTELKCTTRYSKYPLYLFTAAFDGPTFPEINRIVEKYGWPDKDFPDKKVLFTNINFNSKTIVNKKYKFKLQFSEDDEKIFLCVYDKNNILIEKESFIYVDTIYNHLMLKLNRLAIIYASKKKEENDIYYRYYKIDMYQLIGFEKFIDLLKNDLIDVSLISRISKSGVDKGRYRNKNLVFNIKKRNIEKLFEKIYSYNSDEEENKREKFFILNL